MSFAEPILHPSPSGKPEDSILARIFFPREPDANPYYTSNRQLGQCSLLVKELIQKGVPVLSWQGGHRSGLRDDCQITVQSRSTQTLDELCAAHGCRWEPAE